MAIRFVTKKYHVLLCKMYINYFSAPDLFHEICRKTWF